MALQTFTPPSEQPPTLFNTAELIRARAQIQQHLGAYSLDTLNLANELVLQYGMVQELITATINDDSIPLNQRAQAVNSGTQLLIQLGKLQVEVYNANRVQKIQGAVIEVLEGLDEELVRKFLKLLKEALGEGA